MGKVSVYGKIVYLDTNVFIYHFEHVDQLYVATEKIFLGLGENRVRAVTGTVALLELLSIPAPKKNIEKLDTAFSEIPNLKVVELNQDIARKAAHLRRKYRIDVPDAIGLATTICEKVDIFITNDRRLKRVEEVPVLLLETLI